MRICRIRIEWETFDSAKNILFPFDIWLWFPLHKIAHITNISSFQTKRHNKGYEVNLGFLGWRFLLLKYDKWSYHGKK